VLYLKRCAQSNCHFAEGVQKEKGLFEGYDGQVFDLSK